jgi:hypothetical protein
MGMCSRCKRAATAQRLRTCSNSVQRVPSKRRVTVSQTRSKHTVIGTVCILNWNTYKYAHAYLYVWGKKIRHIHTDMHCPKKCICVCSCMYVGRMFTTYWQNVHDFHTWTWYSSYEPLCIEITVSCAYASAYVCCMSFRYIHITHQCICLLYVPQIQTHMHLHNLWCWYRMGTPCLCIQPPRVRLIDSNVLKKTIKTFLCELVTCCGA